MNWLAQLTHSARTRAAEFIHRIRDRLFGQSAQDIRYERVGDFPETLVPATLYVAGNEPYIWAAALLCPCGCGDVIHLNLLEGARPSWTVSTRDNRTVSVTPSIWRTKGCCSHFWIRNSRIDWFRSGLESH